MKIRHKRLAALGGALILGLSTIPVAQGFAFGVSPELAPGNINPEQKGSITVYKHEPGSTKTGKPSDSTDQLTSKAVKDVVFTLYKFDLDLTGVDANANWEKLSTIDEAKLASACGGTAPTLEGFTFGAGQAMDPTNAAGMSKKSGLAVGAYLVCETTAPAGVIGKASPFIVTIPHPDNADGGSGNWLYDVAVFPKNTIGGIDKTIDPQGKHGYGIGSEIHFPVTTDIPEPEKGKEYKYYIIEDTLDPRLEPSVIEHTVDQTKHQVKGVASVKLDGTLLTYGKDYTVTTDGKKIDVSLTAAGLAKLKGKYGKKIETVFVGTVTSLASADKTTGKIPNKAKLYVDFDKIPNVPPETPPTPPTVPPTDPPTPPLESPEVESNWGNVKIQKKDAKNDALLAGATFQVFEADDPYPTNGTCSTEIKADASAISANGTTDFVTDDNGEVTIPGLFVSDSKHEPVNNEFRCYVLVETKAPAGYVLPADAKTAVKVTIGQTAEQTWDAVITNTKQDVPNLPLTGASGQIIMGAVGITALCIAGGLYVASRRRVEA